MNGMSRAVATLLGAGVAGFLLWIAAHVGRQTTGGYWAAYGIVAGAGLVLAVTQLRGRGGNPPGTFLLAFVPVLIVAGWVLLAMQPHPNWFRSHVLSWSGDIGVLDVVHSLATWLGVLAMGIGFVFGVTLEPGMIRRRRTVVEPAPATAPAATPAYDGAAANEPTAAERAEVGDSRVAREDVKTTRTTQVP
jgi:hypothetical protein